MNCDVKSTADRGRETLEASVVLAVTHLQGTARHQSLHIVGIDNEGLVV